ncbi:MAG TPA: gamma-glutamylcyclotransferase family protein [Hyphomicrobiaceae bacterium]|nr:gamma-glutamylcyclotransferase family protein [Hyphomicrobiaceae bacterium]
MNPHLFVYGSLLSTAGHPKGARLAAEARLIGPGSIAGTLYRLSWYPGAVESGERGQRVHGEVYALDDPARSFVWLDAYEGLPPGKLESEKYVRVERPVQLAAGGETTAWVYLYKGDVRGLPRIPDGRWKTGR